MEPRPGPCSSPPGPRPVPPPRKGSVERRSLSPVRRGGEHLGAWDGASEVSGRGSKPGTPERATVTQRVLIVMQSHVSRPPSAETSHGPSTPITSRATPPSTAKGDTEMLPSEGPPPQLPVTPAHHVTSRAPETHTPSTAKGDTEMLPPPQPPVTPIHHVTRRAPETHTPSTAKGDTEMLPPPQPPVTPAHHVTRRAPETHTPSTPKDSHRVSAPENPPMTSVRLPSSANIKPSSVATQNQLMALPHAAAEDRASRGSAVSGQGAPPHCTQDCTIPHGGLSSPRREGMEMPQNISVQEDVTGNMCESAATDGTLQSVVPPQPLNTTASVKDQGVKNAAAARPGHKKSAAAVSPEDVKSAAAVSPEDVKSAAAVSPQDVKSAAAVSPEDGKSAAAVSPQDVKSAAAVSPQDVKSAAAVSPQDVKSAAAVSPQDVKSAAAVSPQDVKSAAAVSPQDVKSAAAVSPQDVKSAAAVSPQDVKSATAVRPENISAPAVRPDMKRTPALKPENVKSVAAVSLEDVKSAAAVSPEDVKSAAAVRPEDVTSSPAVRPDMNSTPALKPENVKSAPVVRPEEVMSTATIRPEAVKSAPVVRPEDVMSTATIRPEDVKSAAAVSPEDVKSSAAVRPEDVKSAAAVRPEDVKSAAAVRPEDVKSAAAVRPEDVKSAAAVRPEDVKSAAAVRPEDVKSAAAGKPEDVKSAAAGKPEDVKSAAAGKPEDVKSAAAGKPEDVKSAAAVRPEDVKSAAAVRPEDVKGAAAGKPEDVKSTPAVQSATISPNLIPQLEAQQKQDGGPVVGNISQTQVNPTSQSHTSSLPAQPGLGLSSLSPIRVPDPSSPQRNMSSKPPLPIPPRSNLYPGHHFREQETSASHETVSLSSFKSKAPAPDTLSYLDSVSLMSGTMESLTLLDDASSIGSDSEINGMPYRKTDKYGFLGGNQYSGNGETSVSVEIARQRELKWLEMFNNWDKWLTRRSQKVKLRCRKGIPSSLRAKAWQFLCNGHDLLIKNPGKFEEMERQHGDPKWLDVIEKDLHRQFPFHEMFAARGGHGQQDLYRILKAYTVYRPEEGYCQAQAPVAAVLLMHMPAEQAFWCLVQICDKYLPGYYSAGLEAIQLDGEIFFALLRRVCPMAYRHLKKFKIDPILYMTEWFMCIFSRTLPWASVLRVWDMFFCEGVKIIFRVGLVLLRHTLGSVDKLRSCQGMYETMEKLRSLPVHCMQEEVLLPEVSSLPVTDALIERESNTQLRKWRENRGELQYRPSRRLHGARQIYEERLRLNPTLSGSRLSLSSIRRPSPPATPVLAVQPESVVVSEGLRPALPSPTSNKAPLGPPREATKKGKEKQREQEKQREKEEREQEKKREKEEREERRKEKEREKHKDKEEKRVQKEREKAESRQKKERKFSFRRKESSSAADSPRNSGPGATDSSATHDTYF